MPGTWFDVYRAFLLRFAFPPSKGGDRGDVHIHAIAGKHYTANNSTPKHLKQLNESTNKHFNNSRPAGYTRAESPDYFSPIPQGWGIDIRTLFGGLKA